MSTKKGKAKRFPRRATKNGEGPRRRWRRQKDFHEGPRRTAKGHEGVGGIRQRSARGGFPRKGSGKKMSTKGEKGKAKRFPRRATKNGEGPRRRWRRLERDPPKVGQGEKRFPGKGKKISTKGHEERRRATKALEEAREGSAKGRQGEKRFPGKGKKISTKGHEERRRATKGLEEAREGSAKGRQGEKRFPRKGKKISTKNGEGPRRGWRRLERDPPKGQGVGKDSKGVREGRRRTAKGEKISTKDTGAIHKVDPGTGRSQNYVPVVRSQRRA